MIGIINYGSGNVQAIANIYNRTNFQYKIIQDPEQLKNVDKLILPGVGDFDETIKVLDSSGLRNALNEEVLVKKKPVLGICVGMQILASIGYEDGINQGLNWFNGEIRKINDTNLKIKTPQMGWNNVCIKENKHPLLENINNEEHFYFANSYHFIGEENAVLGYCEYGVKIASIIAKNNIFATQFHPEKSQENGIKLLSNFLNWNL